MTHICVDNLTVIGSDNGLLAGRRQAIIWTNDEILLIGPSETNFSEVLIEIHIFSLNKMHLKMSSGKWQPFCLDLNVLSNSITIYIYPAANARTHVFVFLEYKVIFMRKCQVYAYWWWILPLCLTSYCRQCVIPFGCYQSGSVDWVMETTLRLVSQYAHNVATDWRHVLPSMK